MTKEAVYKRDQIVGIINSVLEKIQTPSQGIHGALINELGELKRSIENLGKQLHESDAGEISTSHIPNATDELYAVVQATEQASETIMGASEKILEVVKGADQEIFKDVQSYVVEIFEACTFQDITGQRIKKVTDYLKEIDVQTTLVLSLLEGKNNIEMANIAEETSDKSLLNGPSLPHKALSQEDIDKMLEDFEDDNI